MDLIDFGIARGAYQTRFTGTGSLTGTWNYMSPGLAACSARIVTRSDTCCIGLRVV